MTAEKRKTCALNIGIGVLLFLLLGTLLLMCVQIIFHYLPPPARIFIPDAALRPSPTPLSAEEMARRINLNTATLEDLITLPGIGRITAERILALRDSMGSFVYPEDLRRVYGIGEKKVDAIYDLIYVLTPSPSQTPIPVQTDP